MHWLGVIFVMVLTSLPLAVFAYYRRRVRESALTWEVVTRLRSFDVFMAALVIGLGLIWLVAPGVVFASDVRQEAGPADPYASLAAGLAVGLGSLGAAYAVGATGSAAIGAVAERPELFGRVLIFVGLAEGVAIYGLIIAFIILGG
ncbi:MAG: ATP synthase subunit C [Anaerolineae bacterium]